MGYEDDIDSIVAGCKRGDRQSFARLIDLYANRAYGYFCRLTGDYSVSDDLLGELFVKLVEKINAFKGGSFEVWLFKIASNIFRDYLRSKKRDRILLDGYTQQLKDSYIQPKNPYGQESDKLQKGLDRLDIETRELIMLRFYGQLSFKELAEMQQLPIGTVLSKVHRGLKKLREFME